MITCFHKHYNVDDYPLELNKERYMISTGIKDEDWTKLNKIIKKIDPKFVCIDVANGYSERFSNFVRKFRKQYPNVVIIAGNVVTGEMTEELILKR